MNFKTAFLVLLLSSAPLRGETIPHPGNGKVVPLHYFELTANRADKVLWFRIPKNGSRSLVGVLNEAYGQRMTLDPKGIAWSTYSEEEFADYFKFTFVRNPWDRLLSCYKNKVEPRRYCGFRQCWGMSFTQFVEYLAEKELTKLDHHVHPQVRSLPSGVELDFIGRLENFDHDIYLLRERLGVNSSRAVPRRNATRHAHYRAYYTDRTKKIVAKLYKEDIERFGYEF